MIQISFIVDAKQPVVTVEGVFGASTASVWKALTDPALIPSWWGNKESSTVVDKMDVRIGGEWRFVRVNPEGVELAFSGKYLEVEPGRRLVQTFNFEPSGVGHESNRTTALESVDGGKRTKMTATFAYGTPEDLKTDLDAGMEAGTRATWGRLAELIA